MGQAITHQQRKWKIDCFFFNSVLLTRVCRLESNQFSQHVNPSCWLPFLLSLSLSDEKLVGRSGEPISASLDVFQMRKRCLPQKHLLLRQLLIHLHRRRHIPLIPSTRRERFVTRTRCSGRLQILYRVRLLVPLIVHLLLLFQHGLSFPFVEEPTGGCDLACERQDGATVGICGTAVGRGQAAASSVSRKL